LEYLTPDKPPTVIPMHQMYIAAVRDPDWVVRATEGPIQLVSTLSKGLVNALRDSLLHLTTLWS